MTGEQGDRVVETLIGLLGEKLTACGKTMSDIAGFNVRHETTTTVGFESLESIKVRSWTVDAAIYKHRRLICTIVAPEFGCDELDADAIQDAITEAILQQLPQVAGA